MQQIIIFMVMIAFGLGMFIGMIVEADVTKKLRRDIYEFTKRWDLRREWDDYVG